jgi:type IV secretory pathway ATPase VirB11/archaellum biosynthesis ATPase
VVGVDDSRPVQVGSDGTVLGSPFDTRGAHFSSPTVLALSGDGQMLASGVAESGSGIWLWNVADRSFKREPTGALVAELVETLEDRASLLLVGGPGVGKTCVLRALAHKVPQAGIRLTY